MTPQQFAKQILIRARVIGLRRLAEQTARDYRAAQTVDIDLPPRHRELRRMLLGIARGDREEQSPKLLPPPRRAE